MRISTKARYGARALLDLAMHMGEGPVLLKDIAHRQQIPLAYLEHVIASLVAAGFVKSVRGTRGGVWLAKSPPDIRLNEVMETLEGPTIPVKCVGNAKACPRSDLCVTRELWGEVKAAVDKVFESKTLQDLFERQREKAQSETKMYYI